MFSFLLSVFRDLLFSKRRYYSRWPTRAEAIPVLFDNSVAAVGLLLGVSGGGLKEVDIEVALIFSHAIYCSRVNWIHLPHNYFSPRT